MAVLVLDGTEYRCTFGGQRMADEPIGDLSRGITGASQNSVRARKMCWSFSTIPLSQADAETLRTTLAGAAFTASGDLLGGSISVFGDEVTSVVVPHLVSGSWSSNREAVTFLLREAA